MDDTIRVTVELTLDVPDGNDGEIVQYIYAALAAYGVTDPWITKVTRHEEAEFMPSEVDAISTLISALTGRYLDEHMPERVPVTWHAVAYEQGDSTVEVDFIEKGEGGRQFSFTVSLSSSPGVED